MRNEIANFRDCKSIAIMGGTFDPIHHGHLVTAEAVRYRFKVDKVVSSQKSATLFSRTMQLPIMMG